MESPLVRLARTTIETHIKEGKMISPPLDLSPEMQGRAGVFVSLHRGGRLRGCIGTFAPTTENVASEVIRNAIEAALHDPRFAPLRAEELSDLEISVDVLTAPLLVKSADELDAKRYGVIVQSGFRKGLLLPDLPGVDSVEEQVSICRQKAGIGEREAVELYKFEVKRYH